jgi:hypothetical protein
MSSMIKFEWREWWKSERYLLIWLGAVCLLFPAVSVWSGDWETASLGGLLAIFLLIYGAGWHLLALVTLLARAAMGRLRAGQ